MDRPDNLNPNSSSSSSLSDESSSDGRRQSSQTILEIHDEIIRVLPPPTLTRGAAVDSTVPASAPRTNNPAMVKAPKGRTPTPKA